MTTGTPQPIGAATASSAHRGGGFTPGLALVILLNGLLLIRPEELFPALGGLRLYQLAILACLFYYSFSIFAELGWLRLGRNPLLFFILGLQGAVVVSLLGNAKADAALTLGMEFAKLVAYYLVMVAAIRTRAHLRWFFVAFLLFVFVQTALGMGQYFGYVNIEALQQFEQSELDRENESTTLLLRLCGAGIYNDPNDLCLLLTAGILICLDRFLSSGGFLRAAWLLPFGCFSFALTLTHSRGGLLMAAAGLFTYAVARYGVRRGVLLLLLAVPVGFVVFEGRQTRIDLSSREDTSQGRIQLWSDAMSLLPSSPFYGVGAGELSDRIGMVAHNSFVHAYAELGAIGGSLFLAAYAFAFWGVAATRPPKDSPGARDLAGFRLVLIGMIASYAMGMFSLSRNYVPPTYLNLALATIYVRLAASRSPGWSRVDARLAVRVALVGAAGLLFFKLFVMTFARFE